MFNFSSVRRPATIALALTASIAIVACNDNKAPSPVSSVSVTAPVTTLAVGGTTTATATVKATSGTSTAVTWTSTTPAVATVNSTSGVITAVAPGTTDIIATSTADKTKTGKVTITVTAVATKPVVTRVDVTLNPPTVAVGGTSKATARVTGTNNSQDVEFSSSNTNVATIDDNGNITAKAAGTTTITAKSDDDNTKSGTATLTVTAPTPGRSAVRINFAPDGSNVVGYTTNSGAAYNPATMTGWVTEATAGTATPAPLDMTGNVRPTSGVTTAPGAEPAQLTQINMQCGSPTSGSTCFTGTKVAGAFEYKMADGQYNVTVSVGDASASTNANNTNSSHTINVEGTNIINNFVPTQTNLFQKATKQVTVTGGVMTMDAKGGQNTKINYIILEPVN